MQTSHQESEEKKTYEFIGLEHWGSVMTWAASTTGSLILTHLTLCGSSRMNNKVYRNFLFANLQRNTADRNWEKLQHATGQWCKTLFQHKKRISPREKSKRF